MATFSSQNEVFFSFLSEFKEFSYDKIKLNSFSAFKWQDLEECDLVRAN